MATLSDNLGKANCLHWVTGMLWVDDSQDKILPDYYIRDMIPNSLPYKVHVETPCGRRAEKVSVKESIPEQEGDYHKHDFSDSWVYFIEGAGKVKIGTSGNPESRLNDLQTGSPVPLVLFAQMRGSSKTEANLHKKFGASLSHREWYYLTDDLKDYISAFAEILESNLLIDGQFVYIGLSKDKDGRDMRAQSALHNERTIK